MECKIGKEEILQAGSKAQVEAGEADGVHTFIGLICKNHLPKVHEATDKARAAYRRCSNAMAIRKVVQELLGLRQ